MQEQQPIKIQIYPSISKLHTAWKSMISDPPEGYIFIGKESKKEKIIEKAKKSQAIKCLYHLFLKFFKTTAVLKVATKTEILPETELTLSMGTLYEGDKPWIVDIIDTPYCLAGNSYKLFIQNLDNIKSILSKDNCKKIVCANESSIRIMKKYFPKEIIKKVTLIRPAVKTTPFKENTDKFTKNKTTQLLFMGSINNPDDFYMKGGVEVIHTFEELQRKHDVQLVIRCKIPKEFRERVEKNQKIRLIEKEIPYEDLINLYVNSDILFQPSHTYVLMVFLEAMYFGLPIVAIDTYAVGDYIKDGYNGLIVKKSDNLKAYKDETYPNSLRTQEFYNEVKNPDQEFIKRLVDKLSLLVNNPKLRKRLGNNGKKLAATKFSIQTRDKTWKKLFDEILISSNLSSQTDSR